MATKSLNNNNNKNWSLPKAINNKGNDHDQNESNNEPNQQQQEHIEDEEIDSIISDYCTAFWQS